MLKSVFKDQPTACKTDFYRVFSEKNVVLGHAYVTKGTSLDDLVFLRVAIPEPVVERCQENSPMVPVSGMDQEVNVMPKNEEEKKDYNFCTAGPSPQTTETKPAFSDEIVQIVFRMKNNMYKKARMAVKPSAVLGRCMKKFGSKNNVDVDTLIFKVDGREVKPWETVGSLSHDEVMVEMKHRNPWEEI